MLQSHLLSSGATDGEVRVTRHSSHIAHFLLQIYVWDLNTPEKPYTPGKRSTKLDEITSLAWNNKVAYVLATSSSTGYTVVWDLREKREVVALAYGGGAGTSTAGNMQQFGGGAMALGAKRGVSDVCWHPENVSSSAHMSLRLSNVCHRLLGSSLRRKMTRLRL